MEDTLRTWKSSITAPAGGTGSPVSVDGTSPCDGLGGQLPLKYGRGHAPAPRFPSQGASAGPPTIDTCGRSGIGIFASARLQSSLASRLRDDSAWRGGTLWRLTWRRLDTPSGRRCCQLLASVRRICAPDYTGRQSGYPTPTVSEGDYRRSRGKVILKLEGAARMVGWHTPTARSWQAPGATHKLIDQVLQLRGWGTPTAEDVGGTPSLELKRKRRHRDQGKQLGISVTNLAHQVQTLTGALSTGCPAPTGLRAPYRINPNFIRWLMGFPEEWDAVSPGWADWCAAQAAIALVDRADMETPSFQRSPPHG